MRAAVIGVGGIGKHHARIYNDLDDVELVAIADIDPVRREAVAGRMKVRGYADAASLLEREHPDLVSIAVPTASHYPVALAAIQRGVHVLIEKPMAASVTEASLLIALAAQAGVTLSVGHVERFNPAVIELKRRLSEGHLGQIFQIQSRRHSPFPEYVHDVGVVMDLATHELDITRYLLGRDPATVYARTLRCIHPAHEDAVMAILNYADGVAALLDVNWLTPTKLRELRVTGQSGMFLVDYISQDLFLYENSYQPGEWETLAIFRGMAEGNVVKFRLIRQEPLRAELAEFVAAVREKRQPSITGQDGLRALELAELLIQSGNEGRVIAASG